MNFENDAPEVPARDPFAQDLREKIAHFERELADREAERGTEANS